MGSFNTILGLNLENAAASLYGENVIVKYVPSKYPLSPDIWQSVLALIYDGNTGKLIPSYFNPFGVGNFFGLVGNMLAIGNNGINPPRGSLPRGINFNYPDQEVYVQDLVGPADTWSIGFRFTDTSNFYCFQFGDTSVVFDKIVGGTLTYNIASATLAGAIPRTLYVSSVGSAHSFYENNVLKLTVSDTSLTSGGITIAAGADYGNYYNRRNGGYLIKPYGSMPLPRKLPYKAFFIGKVVWDDAQKGYKVDFPLANYSSVVDVDENGAPIEPILVMSAEDATLANFTKLSKSEFIQRLKQKDPGHKWIIELLER